MKSKAILIAGLAGTLLILPRMSRASGLTDPASGASASSQADGTLTSDAQARLNKKQFQNVKVTVNDGVATLTGTVNMYEDKSDAQRRVLHTKGVTAVRNEIRVGGANISDRDLQSKLSEKLAYDPDAYGRLFDAITVRVSDGVVTLGGHAHNYVDRDSAMAIVSTTPGVKDVVDDIEVDPVSGMDDRIRLEVARAVYGFPSLNRYAINPVRPIRIAVQNGNVELYGVVDSQADKDVAGIQANSVPGVFSVKNYLAVANQPTESAK